MRLLRYEEWALVVGLVGAAAVWFAVGASSRIQAYCCVVCVLGGTAMIAIPFILEGRYYYDADQSTPGNSVYLSLIIAGVITVATYAAVVMLSIHAEEWYHSRRSLEQK